MSRRASHETDQGSEYWKHSIVSEEIILEGDAMIHVLTSSVYRWPANRFDCLLTQIYRLSQPTEHHDGNDITSFPQGVSPNNIAHTVPRSNYSGALICTTMASAAFSKVLLLLEELCETDDCAIYQQTSND